MQVTLEELRPCRGLGIVFGLTFTTLSCDVSARHAIIHNGAEGPASPFSKSESQVFYFFTVQGSAWYTTFCIIHSSSDYMSRRNRRKKEIVPGVTKGATA